LKRILIGLMAVVVSLTAFTATDTKGIAIAQTPTAGGLASDGVEYVGFVPFEQSTSTGITIRGKFMYATSWKNISTYDISDPMSPVLLDQLPVGFMFENEDVAVSPDQSFLLFSESLPDNNLRVYDVEDKSNIQEIAQVPGAGDHTTSCILQCTYAYGSDGSITDLRDPANPKVVALSGDPNDWHKKINLQGGGHDVTEIKPGFIIVSPLDAPPLYVDVRVPAQPKVLASGNGPIVRNERGYLWHSGEWPNQGQDRWLLMQGEENFQTECTEEVQGPLATFDTRGWQETKIFKLTDTFKVENGTYSDGSPAANALGCSAHWFEEHKTFNNGGLFVAGYYEHGTRFLNVNSDTGKIKEVDYFLPHGGSTSAAYWVNEEIVYAVDYTRGIDILRLKKPPASGGGGGGGGEDIPGPRVRLGTNDSTPKKGERIRFRTSLRRCQGHAGTNIVLYKKAPGQDSFRKIGAKKLNNACGAVFRHRVTWKGKATFRSVWPKQHDDHRRGQSRPLEVTAR
jgi:hypothetical protein